MALLQVSSPSEVIWSLISKQPITSSHSLMPLLPLPLLVLLLLLQPRLASNSICREGWSWNLALLPPSTGIMGVHRHIWLQVMLLWSLGVCVCSAMYFVYMTSSARVVSSVCMLGKITWSAILIRVYVSIYVCTLFSTLSDDDLCVESFFSWELCRLCFIAMVSRVASQADTSLNLFVTCLLLYFFELLGYFLFLLHSGVLYLCPPPS